MKVTFLGTGTSHGLPRIGCDCAVCTSPHPKNRRLRPSILVENDDASTRLLVDTTPDLREQFLREKINRVTAVLFTHTHNDHVIGLDDLRPITDTQGYLPLFATESTHAHVQNIFGYGFVPNRQHAGFPRFTEKIIEPKIPFEIADFRITPIPILHGKAEIMAFRFENKNQVLVYATDCSFIPEASYPLMNEPDVFIVDALRDEPHPTHFTVAQATAAARRIGAKQTYFTHITHDLDHDATNAQLPEDIEVAYDGLRFEVGPSVEVGAR